MLKSSRKGFTLIEIIVVIVILGVLMAIAVPSVMSYMKEGKKSKYYAISRSAYQNVTVEISKVEAGISDYSTLSQACAAAAGKTNKSSPNDFKSRKGTIKYSNSTITFIPNENLSPSSTGNKATLSAGQSVENIESITFYFKSNGSFTTPTAIVYPNKKVTVSF